jgi:glycosyltransferase involved in cell wall biosynthesis
MKKALIVSPYLDHLGGGERYMLTCASSLESLGYEVSIGWDNLESINNICRMLSIELKAPVLAPHLSGLYHSRNPLSMYMATRPYDVVVYLSDGSIPLLGGRVNLLHMQVPFHNVNGSSWKNTLKLKSIKSIIVNSSFTKKIVDKEYGIDSFVLYPPVSSNKIVGTKEKIILSVGRFEPSLNVKKQDVLINAFKKISSCIPW